MELSAIERITKAGEIYAIVVRRELPAKGLNFVSQPEDFLQLGVNHYEADQVIRAHVHTPVAHQVSEICEMIHIDYGRCLMTIYTKSGEAFHSCELKGGDSVLLLRGGHGFKIYEATRIVEVKQGPYHGTVRDKEYL